MLDILEDNLCSPASINYSLLVRAEPWAWAECVAIEVLLEPRVSMLAAGLLLVWMLITAEEARSACEDVTLVAILTFQHLLPIGLV